MTFSPARLLAFVTVAGLLYAAWFWNHQRVTVFARAGACRANLNLIDRYVATWERANRDVDPARGIIVLELDTEGAITRVSGPAPAALTAGAREIANLAQDPEAFSCPSVERRGPGIVHYRWMASTDPLTELEGGLRGAVCVTHGERRAPDERRAWHALVGGRLP